MSTVSRGAGSSHRWKIVFLLSSLPPSLPIFTIPCATSFMRLRLLLHSFLSFLQYAVDVFVIFRRLTTVTKGSRVLFVDSYSCTVVHA